MCPARGMRISRAVRMRVCRFHACVSGVMVSLSPQIKVTGYGSAAYAAASSLRAIPRSDTSSGSHAATFS